MTNCCSSTCDTPSKKHRCPANGNEYNEVSLKTIIHNIKSPWSFNLKNQPYYFCDDPSCDIVYFGLDNSSIKTEQLRKEKHSLLCYCFAVTATDYANNPEIKDFIIRQTKSGVCSCETHNPSGKCCLKRFPK